MCAVTTTLSRSTRKSSRSSVLVLPTIEPMGSDSHRAVDAIGRRVVVLEREPLDLGVQSVPEGVRIVRENARTTSALLGLARSPVTSPAQYPVGENAAQRSEGRAASRGPGLASFTGLSPAGRHAAAGSRWRQDRCLSQRRFWDSGLCPLQASTGAAGRPESNARSRIRTCDLWLRRPALYPLSYARPGHDSSGPSGRPWIITAWISQSCSWGRPARCRQFSGLPRAC